MYRKLITSKDAKMMCHKQEIRLIMLLRVKMQEWALTTCVRWLCKASCCHRQFFSNVAGFRGHKAGNEDAIQNESTDCFSVLPSMSAALPKGRGSK